LTFEGLVNKARNKLLKPIGYSLPATNDPVEAKNNSSKPA
jgi:hypothetical protein